jgi:hypothetical protein
MDNTEYAENPEGRMQQTQPVVPAMTGGNNTELNKGVPGRELSENAPEMSPTERILQNAQSSFAQTSKKNQIENQSIKPS